eukprot:8967830-Alexandrium_andersonii.AAC.1
MGYKSLPWTCLSKKRNASVRRCRLSPCAPDPFRTSPPGHFLLAMLRTATSLGPLRACRAPGSARGRAHQAGPLPHAPAAAAPPGRSTALGRPHLGRPSGHRP